MLLEGRDFDRVIWLGGWFSVLLEGGDFARGIWLGGWFGVLLEGRDVRSIELFST